MHFSWRSPLRSAAGLALSCVLLVIPARLLNSLCSGTIGRRSSTARRGLANGRRHFGRGQGDASGDAGAGAAECLVPVAGKPILLRQLEELERSGIRKAWLLTGHLGELIEDFAASRSWPLSWRYCAREVLSEPRAAWRRSGAGSRTTSSSSTATWSCASISGGCAPSIAIREPRSPCSRIPTRIPSTAIFWRAAPAPASMGSRARARRGSSITRSGQRGCLICLPACWRRRGGERAGLGGRGCLAAASWPAAARPAYRTPRVGGRGHEGRPSGSPKQDRGGGYSRERPRRGGSLFPARRSSSTGTAR